MASNNNPAHPLQSSAAPSGKSGLGKSAPIRTVPQMSGGIPPPLAVPQHGLAQTSSASSRVSKPSSVTRPMVSNAPQHLAKSPSGSPSKTSVTQTRSPSNQSPFYRLQNNAQLQPHVVPLPPPQQTQIHPLGSPQQHSAVKTQSPQMYQSQQPRQVNSPSQHGVPSPQQKKAASPQQTYQPVKMRQQFQPSRSKVPASPDEEVDAFLLDSQSSTKSQLKTRPSPLPQTDNMLTKAKLLASRRAWGDVIRVTNDALIVKNVEKAGMSCHDAYSELIAAASGQSIPNSAMVDDKVDTIRRETCELITLRCIAHLKLRRYVDLGKEITQLGLIPYLPPHSSSIASNSEITAIPPSPGTEVVPLSSVPTNANAKITHSLSWKEGSIHSPEAQDKIPSWVPYSLRILAAQQLQYVDGSSKAIDVLYDMRDRATRTEYWSTTGMDVWCSTIDNALVHAFVRKKEWRLALHTLEDMLNGLEVGVDREIEWWCQNSGQAVDQENKNVMKDLIASAAAVELMTRQILVLLQCGALDSARTVQIDLLDQVTRIGAITRSTNKSPTLIRLETESALVRQAPFRAKVNEGLLLFASGKYTDATSCFRDVLASQKEFDKVHANTSNQPRGVPSWKELSSPTLGFDAESSLTVECLNNLSLCLLYSGNMRRAVHELEGLVRDDPTLYLTEGMAFNLCTLYELGSDGEDCTRRKKVLQRVAKRFFLHDVGVESFRLN